MENAETPAREWREDPKRDQTWQHLSHGVITGRISFADGQWYWAAYDDGMWTYDAGVAETQDQAKQAVEIATTQG
jgi:hypothetical protein